MLRQIIGRLFGGGRGGSAAGHGTTGGTADSDIQRGARTLFRGLRRKRSGL